MATPRKQRIGIWIIAIVMLIGTVGSFAVMILANQNAKIDQSQQDKLYAEYQKQIADQQKQTDQQTAELSSKYYPVFSPYQGTPTAFDMGAVSNKVTTADLKHGDGTTITKDTKYQAYYIGWNPKGKVFDSSFDGTKLKAPLDTSTLTTIPGWQTGVIGMQVGGVRELTIPSELAYGDKGSGNDIPPNTPIKFIVMIIVTK